MRWTQGKLYTGGKDGFLRVWETASGLSEVHKIDFQGVLIRAIDVNGDNGLVGMRDGTIYQISISSGS